VTLPFVKTLAPSGPIASGMTSHVKFPYAYIKIVQSNLFWGDLFLMQLKLGLFSSFFFSFSQTFR
jgi:hypothetical protein